MKQITRKKLKRSLRCTLSLLLVALTLNSSALAIHTGGFSLSDYITKALDRTNQERQEQQEKELKELYGDEWEKVAALQPGDSYIGKDNMYICHEETYVDWKRVYSTADLDPLGWGGEERLLLMTDTVGENLFVGNDFGKKGGDDSIALWASSPDAVRTVVSGLTADTSDSSTVEYTEEFIFPDMYKYYQEYSRKAKYSYPDTFRTVGTLNAPYIQYAGVDSDNGNQKKFKIILAKDDGSMSGIGLSHNDDCDDLELKAVNECNGFTFYMKDGVLKIFENIKGEDDLLLSFYRGFGEGALSGIAYESFEEMATSNAQLYLGKKTIGTRIETISLKLEDAEQNPDALENVYGGAIEFYHWEKVTSSSQLPTDGGTYRALLVWKDKYFLQGDDFRRKSGDDGMALYVNEENKNGAAPGNVAEVPEIDLGQDEFYTMGGLGSPYLQFIRKDTDSDNDYCPYYSFQLAGMDDHPSRKWLCDGDNILEISLDGTSTKYGGMGVGIIVGQEGDDDNDAEPGKVKLFFNEDGGYDTRFVYSGNVLYGDDSGWDGSGQFTLYIGKPVVYPAIRQNYVVGEDQFMHISQNGAMFKNVTVTVTKGGVLSIESWFMNNGRIIVDGGTLIVQEASNPLGDEMTDDTEDSVMMPFADIHPTVSGSLELQNGGELIILDNARAAFSTIKARSGSSIFNNGLLLAEIIDLEEATLENRKGTDLYVGYDFREIQAFRNGSTSKIIDDLTTRLQYSTPCIVLGKNCGVINDGVIYYGTYRSIPGRDTITEAGSGKLIVEWGKESRYML